MHMVSLAKRVTYRHSWSTSAPLPDEHAAKKQSKWTPEEDNLVIELRGQGMKWDDIAKRLPGRSSISCRLRFKDQMWQKVATEMGIPWRSAESMHWQLGEQGMSARANAPVFQLHPSATGTGMSPPSQAPVVPASAPHGFTPANAPQLMPQPPPMPPQLHQVPPPMPQGPPMHYGHQRTDSSSSTGRRRRRNSSFSRRRADPRSRSSVPLQLGLSLQPQPEEDWIGGARTAPVPGMQLIIKQEMDGSSYMEAYHQRRREEEAAAG
ncbi:MYB DNA-binding domain containing protein [Stemphylium lycopersici]|uniref:MYB DNA-binding domain containing protein n=1 Tax=Stemphylium lycopersici TaxID=183478 RepID=A0A364MVV0_STELY|nr:MYB DNA-binding domain containing protein [Stemphylium lycopersici]